MTKTVGVFGGRKKSYSAVARGSILVFFSANKTPLVSVDLIEGKESSHVRMSNIVKTEEYIQFYQWSEIENNV